MIGIASVTALLSFAAAAVAQSHHTISVVNKCPSDITWFNSGVSQGTLKKGSSTNVTFPSTFSGFIYSNANGGNQNGQGTTRAGFYLPSAYYYIVQDPAHFNTGISIQGVFAQQNGFCALDNVDSVKAPNAFQSPPTAFPKPSAAAPKPPLFECPGDGAGYVVTFCPSGSFPSGPTPPPPSGGKAIHPNGNTKKCLDVRAAKFANGTPVQIYDCNNTPAQQWVVNRANTKVQVAGTNFCLDAGANPASGVGMKIWQCYDNLPAQAWYYTDDNRIAVTGKGQCLDLKGGSLQNGNQVQTWQCTNFNTNQIWTQ